MQRNAGYKSLIAQELNEDMHIKMECTMADRRAEDGQRRSSLYSRIICARVFRVQNSVITDSAPDGTSVTSQPRNRGLTRLRKTVDLQTKIVTVDRFMAGPCLAVSPEGPSSAIPTAMRKRSVKLAKASYASDGASCRVSRRQRSRAEKGIRVGNPPSKRAGKKMTADEQRHAGGYVGVSSKVDVRDRVKRIERAFQDGSTTNTLSGELRKEGPIEELKERGRIQRDREIADRSKVDTVIPRSDERWEEGPARREELARRVIEECGSSISSLSQLLGNHYGSGRSAQLNLLTMVDDEAERRSSNHGESLFETDDDELSPMEREMTRPRPATLNIAYPLHLASLSRGKEELKRPRNPRSRKTKPGSKASRDRNVNVARPQSRTATQRAFPPSSAIADDELDVSELPPQNGSGIQWDWSRIHKYGGKAVLALTGLACTVPESTRQDGLEAMMAEQSLPVQPISSLDFDANALPLIIGKDAHDSDFASGYSIESGGSREVPQKLATKRKASLPNAVKDVPVVTEPVSTSSSKEGLATPPPEEPRTLTQKYRPKNFREIVGQSVAVKSLSTAIMKGKVASVYLFMGPRGTGKTSAARVFAAGLNCEVLDSARRPCQICRQCGTLALNRSVDVLEIDATSNMDLASIREAMGSLQPVGRYKVFIVEGCESLSTDIWNALLKVLDEPPTNVVFILITTDHAQQIPDSVTSRCQKFHFSKVDEADIATRLEVLARKEGLDVEEGALALIVARSEGSLRDAEIMLDQVRRLDANVSVALVRELLGLLPDTEILDLLDYALSADTMNTVGTLREALASGIEPLSLVSQLRTVITDVLTGSYDVRRETRREGSFFKRNFSVTEEQHCLRQALKILAASEKQLRVTSDRATWLAAGLLQFALDRSFLSSEENTSVTPSPLATQNSPRNSPEHPRPVLNYSFPTLVLPSMDKHQTEVGSSKGLGRTLQGEAENATSLFCQMPEQAWAKEPQQYVSSEYVRETPNTRRAPEISLEFQLFKDKALPELWKRVLWEVTSVNLREFLQKDGLLVAACVAIDGSCAFVKLEFDYLSHKRQADRSWRSICRAFQAVLSTAIKLQMVLSSTATPSKNTKNVTRDSSNHRNRSTTDTVFSQTVRAKEEYPSETETEVPGEECATGPVDRLDLVKTLGLVERLDSYLKRAVECVEAVRRMPLRKFNNEQCKYLADKLQVVVQSASTFLELLSTKYHEPRSSEDMGRRVEILKLLLALGKEIERFIQGCCEDGWIQASMTLTNVSEYVSLIGFNLELCRVALNCDECAASGSLSLDQVADIHKDEVEVVKKKASADVDTLIAKVIYGQIQKSLSSEENDLASYLLLRLHRVKLDRPSSSSGSPWWNVMGDLYKWVKPLEKLGKGSSGTVYKAMWLGTPVAKKTFIGQSNPDFKREAEVLGGLCHPNITSMFCCTVEKNSCSIIMELMDEDLHDLMQRRCNTRFHGTPFTILEAVDIMLQVAEGVNYLHHQVAPSIVHRDLKSSNILIKCVIGPESEIGYVLAKVTDFGLSKTKDCSTRYSQQTPNMGTNKWMAPEMIKIDVRSEESTSSSDEVPSYPHKSDVYSFAILCYEILTGHEPFPNELPNTVKKKVLNGERPDLPDHCPLELKALIKECWNQESKKRPSFDVICLQLKYLKYLLMTGLISLSRSSSLD